MAAEVEDELIEIWNIEYFEIEMKAYLDCQLIIEVLYCDALKMGYDYLDFGYNIG